MLKIRGVLLYRGNHEKNVGWQKRHLIVGLDTTKRAQCTLDQPLVKLKATENFLLVHDIKKHDQAARNVPREARMFSEHILTPDMCSDLF